MSMLAGPRRKQKVINLRAKNNAWSNDSNKFGQKMLEKMGWSAGKGLGANENGMVEHVIARYKNDEKGLGFEDKNDQWTKHDDDFNALLANLSNGEVKEPVLHSGVSLEDKSKKSKARVHYHKFTRGKDLSRYSEKDLANIFGKKTFKHTEAEPEVEIDDVKTTEQVFTEKGSMDDYFKNKLTAIKFKNKDVSFEYENNDDNSADYAFKGFAGGNNDDSEINHAPMGFGYQASFVQSCVNQPDSTEEVEPEIKKKKKKSKRKHDDESQPHDLVISCNQSQTESKEIKNQEVVDEPEKPPKKKKNKKKYEDSEKHDNTVEVIEEILLPKKKKKKNKKSES